MTRYRVTWQTIEAIDETVPLEEQKFETVDHERIFDDVDQGYDFYQDLQKGSSRTYAATWEHIS